MLSIEIMVIREITNKQCPRVINCFCKCIYASIYLQKLLETLVLFHFTSLMLILISAKVSNCLKHKKLFRSTILMSGCK